MRGRRKARQGQTQAAVKRRTDEPRRRARLGCALGEELPRPRAGQRAQAGGAPNSAVERQARPAPLQRAGSPAGGSPAAHVVRALLKMGLMGSDSATLTRHGSTSDSHLAVKSGANGTRRRKPHISARTHAPARATAHTNICRSERQRAVSHIGFRSGRAPRGVAPAAAVVEERHAQAAGLHAARDLGVGVRQAPLRRVEQRQRRGRCLGGRSRAGAACGAGMRSDHSSESSQGPRTGAASVAKHVTHCNATQCNSKTPPPRLQYVWRAEGAGLVVAQHQRQARQLRARARARARRGVRPRRRARRRGQQPAQARPLRRRQRSL